MEEVENETDKVQSVMEAFQRYDQDGDGMINFKELAALMRDLAGSAGDWDDHQIRVLLKAMDSDNDGKVILTEFGAWLFGSQLSDEDESKLKTAELKLATGTEKAEGRSNAGNGGESKLSKIRSGTSGTSGEGGTSEKRDKERDKTAWRPGRRLPEGAEQGDDEEEEEVEEDEEDEDGDAEEEEEEPEDPEEPEEDWEEFDEKMFNKLSQSGRSALWQRLMPAREGSAQDAAQRMKSLKPPNPKRPNDHKHALLYLQNHAGGNADLAGQPPDGADRKKALQWLKDALLKISEAHDKSYQLPVKWLIGNWRLWPDEDEGDSKKDPGFVDLKNLAIRKLDGIGKKYEDLYKERKLGMELGFIGENLTFEIRPRQDHYLVPPGYFGLKELHDRALGNKPTDTELHEHERKKQSSFIIFLLTAVHGVDHIFQEVAKEICESVAGTSRAPPPKGFMRMWAKLDTDHASAKSPRAAENIDTNRVAWIFEEPSQLRDAFEKAQKIFGAPLRVKNGYDPAFPAMAETKGYRNILANYQFSPEITWGALAGREGPNEKATKTEAAWDKFRKLLLDTFLNMGYADEAAFDDELTYYMHCCEAARAYYCSKDMQKKPVEIVVEIQYMLQSYFDMRKYTHTWYKIVRAEDPEALVVDYNS